VKNLFCVSLCVVVIGPRFVTTLHVFGAAFGVSLVFHCPSGVVLVGSDHNHVGVMLAWTGWSCESMLAP
jgi:hypothetical protein